MPNLRLVEARSIITHGLGESGASHEAYMDEFRRMVSQIERLYPLWLSDKAKSAAPAAVDAGNEQPLVGKEQHP